MLFWIIAAALTLTTFAMVLAPMFGAQAAAQDAPDLGLYKAQLAEIDRDVARGVLLEDEAERIRAEVARRLLAASKQVTQDAAQPKAWPFAALGFVLAGGLAVAVYTALGAPGLKDMPLGVRLAEAEALRNARPDQASAEASARIPTASDSGPEFGPESGPESGPNFPQDYLDSVAKLRRLMPGRPDDVQGWELLAYHEARLRNFPAAARAQGKLIAAKGAAVTAQDLTRHADLMVAAADGYVSPEAEAIVRQVLERAPLSVAGRYYLGAMHDQTGRYDLAFQLWQPIVKAGPQAGPYGALARRQIERAAFLAGQKYTLPAPVMASANLPGPSHEQMRAAGDMAPEDRQAMIEGMVEGLASRLAQDGGAPEEWARLISAYAVLGRVEDARAALSSARSSFADSGAALAMIEQAASTLPKGQ